MPRTRQQARFVGLWTAAWLFALLLLLLLWLGDLALQWPVLLVPVLWALAALRRGRSQRPPADVPEEWPDAWPDDEPDEAPAHEARPPVTPPQRRLPPTRELPWLPEVPRDRREE